LYMCKLTGYSASLSYYTNNTWTNIVSGTNMPFGAGHAFGVEQLQNGEKILISYGTNLRRLDVLAYNPPTIPNYEVILPVHVDVEDVVYHPYNSNEVWICTHGGPEKSVNEGFSWTAKYNGVGTAITTKMATSYTNPEYVMLGLNHDGTQITRTPYSDNWNPNWQVVSWGDGQQPLIDNKDPKYMWSSYQGQPPPNPTYANYSDYYFLNGTNYSIPLYTFWYTQMVLNKENSNYLYANSKPNISESKEEVKRFTSRGATSGNFISNFKGMLDPSITMILTIGMVTPYYSNDELVVWVDTRGGSTGNGFHVFRTRNATSESPTWIELSIPRAGWINEIEFDPNNSDIVYLCYSNSLDELEWPLSKQLIYKIDYTSVTTPIFTDITKNLPYTFTGSYCLEYERGSDGVLYIATDYGIFTTNNQLLTTSDSWQTVGVGFPHCASSQGIEINYPKNLLRVGTGGRGAWEIPLPCTNESIKIIINQNTTWNTVQRLNKGIVVKNGYTLTLNQNAKISLPEGDGIVVEPGAKLIINGATLSNACANGQWQGIEVWGNSAQHQYTVGGVCAQGTVELKNGAVIENAMNGITNWKPDDWNSIGGIIQATDATFRNNRRSVEFMKYRNFDLGSGRETDNLSFFNNCTFEVNDNYSLNASPYYTGVSLWYVKGVKFNGCDFLWYMFARCRL
jgi:hypothetical protein